MAMVPRHPESMMLDPEPWTIPRDSAEPFVVDDSMGFLVNRLARVFAAALQARLASLGLSIGAFPVLLALWTRDGRSQREIAEALPMDETTLVRTLDRMQRDGLVVRERDTGDRRRVLIHLTDHGRALRDPALAAADAVNAQALSGFDAADATAARALIGRMIAGLVFQADTASSR